MWALLVCFLLSIELVKALNIDERRRREIHQAPVFLGFLFFNEHLPMVVRRWND